MDAKTRQLIVEEALTWQGTPYAHNQATKGMAADCALFPLAVFRSVGLLKSKVAIPEYSPQWFLHRNEELYENTVLELGAIPTEDLSPGNFILWKIGRTYSHGGIIISWPTIIHALRPRNVMLADATNDGTVSHKPYKVFTV